ncbi:MAG: hypothetical protein HYX94_00380 [Chloroflexi bacterium]|nr:hypothetical protein [Chloroflexota bacterium]
MVKASDGGVVKARFAYDGDGKRVKRVDANGTSHYVGSNYEVNKGNGLDTTEKVTKYYYGALGPSRRLIALRKNGTLYYVLSDHLGSTTKTIDVSGNEVDLLRYTTYGETRQGGGNTPTDVRYTGQVLDTSRGLYW